MKMFFLLVLVSYVNQPC